MLLGRTSGKVPTGIVKVEWNSSKGRLDFIARIVISFWKKWQRDYFHTLTVRQNWHLSQRNVRSDDVVFHEDKDADTGKWKLAQIKSVEPSRDGRVRCYCTL